MRMLLASRMVRIFVLLMISLLSAVAQAHAVPLHPGEITRLPLIKRRSIESTSIASVGYRTRLRLLEIQFHTGVIYRYSDVPPSVYKAFLKAKSKGRYFTLNIRSRFPFSRVDTQHP